MFGKVLIPVDFSLYSEFALKKSEFLKDLGAKRFTLLHVVDETIFEMLKSTIWQDRIESIDAAIEDAVERAKSMLENVSFPFDAERVVEVGHPGRKIAELSEDYDLIYMGARGWHWRSKRGIGDVAMEVAENAKCSTIFAKFEVVDGEITYNFPSPFEKILFATDFSSAAEFAKGLAKRLVQLGSHAVIVAIAEHPHHMLEELAFQEFKERVVKLKKEFGNDTITKVHVERGNAAVELPRIIEMEKPSMIVLGATGIDKSGGIGRTAESVLKKCYGMIFLARPKV